MDTERSETEHREPTSLAGNLLLEQDVDETLDGSEEDSVVCGIPDSPEPDESGPDESWEVDRLTAYVGAQLTLFEKQSDVVARLSRKSAVLLFRAGRALSLIRSKLKLKKGWEQWLKDHSLGKTSAWKAIALYKRVDDEAVVANMSVTKAMRLYGIEKKRSVGDDTHAVPPSQQDTNIGTSAGPATPSAESLSQSPKTPSPEQAPADGEPASASSGMSLQMELEDVYDRLALCAASAAGARNAAECRTILGRIRELVDHIDGVLAEVP